MVEVAEPKERAESTELGELHDIYMIFFYKLHEKFEWMNKWVTDWLNERKAQFN